MANIKNMEMVPKLFSNKDISVQKSFFGLCTKIVFEPTHSSLRGVNKEYSVEAGKKLQAILECSEEQLEEKIKATGDIETVSLGTMRLDAAVSADRQFVAAQLFQYSSNRFSPVTDVLFYEGKQAELITSVI